MPEQSIIFLDRIFAAETCDCSHQSLKPYHAFSLWDMTEFLGGDFVTGTIALMSWEMVFRDICREKGPNTPLGDVTKKNLTNVIKSLAIECHRIGLDGTMHRIDGVLRRLEGILGEINSQIIETDIRSIRDMIMCEMDEHKFVYIPKDSSKFFEKSDLFGKKVKLRFKSAAYDIREAGNCFSVGLHTATVFHLMRVAERGLRALAKERKVKLPGKKPIEWAEWQAIITGIEQKVDPIKNWKKGQRKDKAIGFYRGAIGEFYAFKDAYRNHVMHTRSKYDLHQAASVMQHVSEFMKRLAEHIDENPTKAIKW